MVIGFPGDFLDTNDEELLFFDVLDIVSFVAVRIFVRRIETLALCDFCRHKRFGYGVGYPVNLLHQFD